MNIKLNKSAYVALGLICKGPVSGYDLKKTLTKISRLYWSESNAQIYPILKKLEEIGYVKSKLDKASGARGRKIYTATAKGKRAVENWLKEPSSPTPYREELLLKLALGQFTTKKVIAEHLERYRKAIIQQIEEHQQVLEHIAVDHKGYDDQAFLIMIHKHIEGILQTKKAWCEEEM